MIRVSSPMLIGKERDYVLDCLDREELSSIGSYVERLETAFARFCEVKHAIACCNGTAALHLSLLALDVGPGDDVFVPALTYIATANAVRYCGANPVFVDVDPLTWCMSPEDLVRKIARSSTPCGVLPVHLYGLPANMQAISRIAEASDLWVVEDAAEAHGATHHGKPVGSLGDLGTFSFYGNKILTCGEGGIVTTNDNDLAELARLYRGQGMDPDRRYHHSVVGYNYRLTNIQAAIALAQLELLPEHAARRLTVCEHYREELNGFITQENDGRGVSANWMFNVLVPEGVDRDTVMRQMAHEGIETRPVFPPLQRMPPYLGISLPNASYISDHGITLPTHGRLTSEEQDTVIGAFRKAVA